MTALLNVFLILISSLLLIKSTEFFIKSSSRVARHLHLPEYTISFFLIAIGTSVPEMVVGIASALDKQPILSFGTIIGSNIALITLIPAIPVLLGGKIHTHNIVKTKDVYYAIMFCLLPIFLSLDGVLSQHDGILLLIGFALYSTLFLRRNTGIESLVSHFVKVDLFKEMALFLISLAVIVVSSNQIVHSAEILSLKIGLGLAFIGLTLTAIGTSLPEISFSIQAVKNHKQSVLLGDLIGSLVANSALVLGITAIIYPIEIPNSNFLVTSSLLVIAAAAIFLKVVKSHDEIDKWEAASLVFVYFIFLLGEFFFK